MGAYRESDDMFPVLRNVADTDARNALALCCGVGDGFPYHMADTAKILRRSLPEILLLVGEGITELRRTNHILIADEFEAIVNERAGADAN